MSRRFSKTQKYVNYDESTETTTLNNWVTSMLSNYHSGQNLMSSHFILTDQRSHRFAEFPEKKDIMLYENLINSNDFNAFELHSLTKKNSLYFMLQYMYQKFDFKEQLKYDTNKY